MQSCIGYSLGKENDSMSQPFSFILLSIDQKWKGPVVAVSVVNLQEDKKVISAII